MRIQASEEPIASFTRRRHGRILRVDDRT